MEPLGNSKEFRATRGSTNLTIALSCFLLLIAIWLAYEAIRGKGTPFLEGSGALLLGSIFYATYGITLATGRLTFTQDKLSYNSFFVHQSVQLSTLSSVKYVQIYTGKFGSWVLRLTDNSGQVLNIRPTDYSGTTIREIYARLNPYIIASTVAKNFTTLEDKLLPIDPHPVQRSAAGNIGHALRGVFLFILLPCLLITALIIGWAIMTHKPGF